MPLPTVLYSKAEAAGALVEPTYRATVETWIFSLSISMYAVYRFIVGIVKSLRLSTSLITVVVLLHLTNRHALLALLRTVFSLLRMPTNVSKLTYWLSSLALSSFRLISCLLLTTLSDLTSRLMQRAMKSRLSCNSSLPCSFPFISFNIASGTRSCSIR